MLHKIKLKTFNCNKTKTDFLPIKISSMMVPQATIDFRKKFNYAKNFNTKIRQTIKKKILFQKSFGIKADLEFGIDR